VFNIGSQTDEKELAEQEKILYLGDENLAEMRETAGEDNEDSGSEANSLDDSLRIENYLKVEDEPNREVPKMSLELQKLKGSAEIIDDRDGAMSKRAGKKLRRVMRTKKHMGERTTNESEPEGETKEQQEGQSDQVGQTGNLLLLPGEQNGVVGAEGEAQEEGQRPKSASKERKKKKKKKRQQKKDKSQSPTPVRFRRKAPQSFAQTTLLNFDGMSYPEKLEATKEGLARGTMNSPQRMEKLRFHAKKNRLKSSISLVNLEDSSGSDSGIVQRMVRREVDKMRGTRDSFRPSGGQGGYSSEDRVMDSDMSREIDAESEINLSKNKSKTAKFRTSIRSSGSSAFGTPDIDFRESQSSKKKGGNLKDGLKKTLRSIGRETSVMASQTTLQTETTLEEVSEDYGERSENISESLQHLKSPKSTGSQSARKKKEILLAYKKMEVKAKKKSREIHPDGDEDVGAERDGYAGRARAPGRRKTQKMQLEVSPGDPRLVESHRIEGSDGSRDARKLSSSVALENESFDIASGNQSDKKRKKKKTHIYRDFMGGNRLLSKSPRNAMSNSDSDSLQSDEEGPSTAKEKKGDDSARGMINKPSFLASLFKLRVAPSQEEMSEKHEDGSSTGRSKAILAFTAFLTKLRQNDRKDHPSYALLSKISKMQMRKVRRLACTTRFCIRIINQFYAQRLVMETTGKMDSMKNTEIVTYVYDILMQKYGFKKVAEEKFTSVLCSCQVNTNTPRIKLFGRMLGLYEPLEKDTINWIFEAVRYIHNLRYGKDVDKDDKEEIKYISYIKAIDWARFFFENQSSWEEWMEIKRKVDNLNVDSGKKLMYRGGMIDQDAYFLALINFYTRLKGRTRDVREDIFLVFNSDEKGVLTQSEFTLLASVFNPEADQNSIRERLSQIKSQMEYNEPVLTHTDFIDISKELDLFSTEAEREVLKSNNYKELVEKVKGLAEEWAWKKGVFEKLIQTEENPNEKKIYSTVFNKVNASLKNIAGVNHKVLWIAFRILETKLLAPLIDDTVDDIVEENVPDYLARISREYGKKPQDEDGEGEKERAVTHKESKSIGTGPLDDDDSGVGIFISTNLKKTKSEKSGSVGSNGPNSPERHIPHRTTSEPNINTPTKERDESVGSPDRKSAPAGLGSLGAGLLGGLTGMSNYGRNVSEVHEVSEVDEEEEKEISPSHGKQRQPSALSSLFQVVAKSSPRNSQDIGQGHLSGENSEKSDEEIAESGGNQEVETVDPTTEFGDNGIKTIELDDEGELVEGEHNVSVENRGNEGSESEVNSLKAGRSLEEGESSIEVDELANKKSQGTGGRGAPAIIVTPTTEDHVLITEAVMYNKLGNSSHD